jgi:hypothetical protein
LQPWSPCTSRHGAPAALPGECCLDSYLVHVWPLGQRIVRAILAGRLRSEKTGAILSHLQIRTSREEIRRQTVMDTAEMSPSDICQGDRLR